MHDPRIWLDNWIHSKGIKIKPGQILEMKGKETPINNIVQEMNCDFISHKPKKSRITLPSLKDALELKILAMNEEVLRQAIATMKYKPDPNENMKEFVRALIGRDDDVVESVLRHFCWQAKRKIFCKDVFDHLMPIIYGSKQRQGKSSAIKKFLSPINGFWCNAKISDITDDKKAKMFTTNFAIFFDEMQGATKTDMESIKERLTSDFISFRPLYQDQVVSIRNNATPIGVTNKPLELMLRDSTGMRRFFQIDIENKCDWDAINKIDFKALWQDIDENRQTTYIESFRDQIEAVQEEIRDKCSVEQWIEEFSINKGGMRNVMSEVYSAYTYYCRNSGMHPDPKRIFGIKIRELLKVRSLAVNGVRYYDLNKYVAPVLAQSLEQMSTEKTDEK